MAFTRATVGDHPGRHDPQVRLVRLFDVRLPGFAFADKIIGIGWQFRRRDQQGYGRGVG